MNLESLRDKLEKDGFLDLGIINPKKNTLEIANELGRIVRIPGLSDVQIISPRSRDELPANTYSGIFGLEKFPMHTDLAHWYEPPRYFVLRCRVPDTNVKTLFVSFKKALIGLNSQTIARAMFKPRRKLENKQFLLRFNSSGIFRWDSTFLVPENLEAMEVSRHLCDIDLLKVKNIVLTEPGQTVLVDNWQVLHGRSEVPGGIRTRLIERVYMSEIVL